MKMHFSALLNKQMLDFDIFLHARQFFWNWISKFGLNCVITHAINTFETIMREVVINAINFDFFSPFKLFLLWNTHKAFVKFWA